MKVFSLYCGRVLEGAHPNLRWLELQMSERPGLGIPETSGIRKEEISSAVWSTSVLYTTDHTQRHASMYTHPIRPLDPEEHFRPHPRT